MTTEVIAYLDKTVIRITGLKVAGLRPHDLEQKLHSHVGRPVRVIGVTGESIEMDVYGLAPEALLIDKRGIIKAVSAVPGIRPTDLVRMRSTEKAVAVGLDHIQPGTPRSCAREQWFAPNR